MHTVEITSSFALYLYVFTAQLLRYLALITHMYEVNIKY